MLGKPTVNSRWNSHFTKPGESYTEFATYTKSPRVCLSVVLECIYLQGSVQCVEPIEYRCSEKVDLMIHTLVTDDQYR